MTEEIEAIAKRLVAGRKRDGRSVYDARAKSELIKVARQPGISLAKIARTCGINANVLSNWMRSHEHGKTTAGAVPCGEVIEMPAPAFVALQLESAATAPPAVAGLDVQVRLPNGVAVEMRGHDLDGALKLIEALGRVRCSVSTKG